LSSSVPPAAGAGAQHVRHREPPRISVDVERLAKELGVPVVTSIAVRKGGTADLLTLTDEISASSQPSRKRTTGARSASPSCAHPARADRIITDCVSLPSRPDT